MYLIHTPLTYHKYTLTHTTYIHTGHTHTDTRTHTHARTHTHTCMHAHTHRRTYTHTHTGTLTRLSLNVYDLMASSNIFKKCGEDVQTLPDTCGTRTPFIKRASDFTGAALNGYIF